MLTFGIIWLMLLLVAYVLSYAKQRRIANRNLVAARRAV